MPTPPSGALGDTELGRLAAFLAKCKGGRAMNLEQLDGFFAALIAGPEMVMPSEYWPVALGGNLGEVHTFESLEEVNAILQLFMRHWNTIATTLDRGKIYELYLQRDASHLVSGTDWANGFMRGVDQRYERWLPLIDSKEHGEAILPMMALAQDKDAATHRDIKPITAENRRQLLALMAVGLTDIHRFFSEARRTFQGPVRRSKSARRAAPKVGRNDPCPCGSGKKYKLCCAVPDASTVH